MGMDKWTVFAYLIFPYLALTIFAVGHAYRHFTDPFTWNPRSSELLEKQSLKYGIYLFHWGMILVLIGHAGGLLIPETMYDAVGISGEAHARLAIFLGIFFGLIALPGILLLLWRRATKNRILAVTSINDFATSILLLFVIASGTYNVFFGHYYFLDTVAPWIRGIVTFAPEPQLMEEVPFSYKIHILGAFVLFAFSPFTRLVHIWSVPLGYMFRSYILFRSHKVNIPSEF